MAIKMSFGRWIAGATVCALGLWSVSALAAPVPGTLIQQGRILNTAGDPISSKVKIVFNVYADPKGGDALWTEEHDVTLDDGYFSAELGAGTPATPIPDTLFDGTERYLGVTVGSDDEMTPRQAITSVPYALKAGVADVAGSASFTSLTDIPAACAAGMYLKGFDATGAAQCATLPATTCIARYADITSGTTTAEAGCPAGEFMTGGGCNTNGIALTASYPRVCTNSGNTAADVTPPIGSVGTAATLPVNPPIIIQPICLLDGKWGCTTASAANITAFAMCCKVQ